MGAATIPSSNLFNIFDENVWKPVGKMLPANKRFAFTLHCQQCFVPQQTRRNRSCELLRYRSHSFTILSARWAIAGQCSSSTELPTLIFGLPFSVTQERDETCCRRGLGLASFQSTFQAKSSVFIRVPESMASRVKETKLYGSFHKHVLVVLMSQPHSMSSTMPLSR